MKRALFPLMNCANQKEQLAMKKLIKIAIGAALVASSSVSYASAAAEKLALSQAVASVDVSKLPTCSKTTKSNCKKRGAGNTWLIVGGLAVAVGAVLAADSNSVSP